MELRKDYILDRYVIIVPGRGKRPHQFNVDSKKEDVKADFFAPGNENMTPPEIGRIEKDGKWKLRWFDNKFPAVDKKGDPEIKTDNKYFTFSDAYGKHEVIVETPRLDEQFWDLDEKDIVDVLKVYKERITEISKDENIRYVCVFKNHGKAAGTSILHSHSQLIATNFLPTNVIDKVEAVKRYNQCPYCEIIEAESKGIRKCFENDSFLAFTPYASRYNYELLIFPKEHTKNITEMDEDKLKKLAEIMKKAASRLKELGCSYNFELFYSPEQADLHFHIEVTPRIAVHAGFEILSGACINTVSPEDAAKFYREDGNN